MSSAQDFLVEIGTEELPPKALKSLSEAFAQSLASQFTELHLGFEDMDVFASPRRLAVRVNQLTTAQPDIDIERRGPAKQAAFDAEGKPTKALEGFMRSCNATLDQLTTLETDKGAWMVFRSKQPGKQAVDLLPETVRKALDALPIPKRMRWGSSRTEFVRPVHWIVMMLGEQVIPCEILGLPAGQTTRGHRFHANVEITINHPDFYETLLREKGYVIASFAERSDIIRQAVLEQAASVNGQALIDEELLEEVTALNEWPVPLMGRFEERFLEVPAEALISTMKGNQKYFPVVDAQQKLMPYFITISNIESKDPQQVIAGNERVVRPRLADAAFFFETDRKTKLADRLDQLKPIVFQNQLGSLYDKSQRIARLAGLIAKAIGGEAQLAERAGLLSKTDLVTNMVSEFPELQGVMGRYYAQHDNEPEEVAVAQFEQYLPRFSGDELPRTKTGCAVAIADRVDSLVGLFGIDQPPSGTKDPFALRRASLGVLRIIVERELPLDLAEVLKWAHEGYAQLPAANVETKVLDYMLERFRAWYEEEGIPAEVFQAVHARRPTRPVDFHQRVQAVRAFSELPDAEALAAANKRVSNILSKQHATDIALQFHPERLVEEAEKALAEMIATKEKEVLPLFEARKYGEGLARLAELREAVDRFFDQVMVMAEDEDLRNNRIALLSRLRHLFLQVADISFLQGRS